MIGLSGNRVAMNVTAMGQGSCGQELSGDRDDRYPHHRRELPL
jgi:hypothetical protein